ncbi:MAG: 50S ribosomal protein L4 [Candidatus Omnitrophota bacterium]|nr:50S ribosomal protein L4 [Candidatus Omnitrophota bacterium]
MEAITLPIYSIEGIETGTIKLDGKIFDGTVNKEAIYQAVVAYRANHRKGLAATKTRGEVSGGGRKPWKQKGTGRARVGSTRSPLWRHGGVVFGPHPKDFSYNLPQKIRALALKSSLNAKVKENNFLVLEDLKLAGPKTKDAAKVLTNLKLGPGVKTLVLLEKMDKFANMAIRNIACVDVAQAKDANVYEIMSHKKLIITKNGLNGIYSRFAPPAAKAAKLGTGAQK